MAVAPRKIVIVEDENIVAKNLQLLLIRMNYVVPAISAYGEDLLELTEEHTPDVVLIDIGLRGKIDGIEAARRLHEVKDIPVIFITANSDVTTLERAKIAQPYGFILKPFDDREIQSMIEMAVSRHQADREIAESRKWLATTLQSIGDAVIATDELGTIKFMNPVAEKLTGWSQSEAVGMNLLNVFKIISLGTRSAVNNPVDLVLRDGHIVGLANHTILIAKDGTEYNIDDSAAPIHGPTGSIIGVVLIFRDITEKYKIEAAIEANERRFRALVENNTDMVRMVNSEGKIIYLSPSVIRTTGYSLQELQNQSMMDMIHPDDQPEAQVKLAAVLRNPGIPIQFQHRVSHKDGHWLWVEGIITNLLHDPAIGALVSNARDISSRKIAEDKINVSEEKYRSLVDDSPDIIMTLDREYNVTFINRTVPGITKEEVLGSSAFTFVPKEYAQLTKENFDKVFTLKTQQTYEAGAPGPNGTIAWYVSHVSPIFFGKEVVGITLTMRDITDRKLAEVTEKRSSYRLRSVLDSLQEGIVIYNENLEIVDANPLAEHILGLPLDELKRRTSIDPLWGAIHEDNSPFLGEDHPSSVCLRTGMSSTGVVMGIHKPNGTLTWVSINANPLYFDGSPKPNGVVKSFVDITESRHVNEIFQRNNQLLSESQSIGKLGGWELDLASGDLFWTAETYRIHDTSPEEFNPTVDAGVSYFLPDSKKQISEALELAITQGIGYDLYLETYTTKGRKIDVRTTCEVTCVDGNPTKLTGIFQDITNQKKNEKEILDSKLFLLKAQQAAGIGVYRADLKTECLECSPETDSLFGIDEHYPHTIEGWTKFMHPDYVQKMDDYFREVVSEKKSFDFEYKIIRPVDGVERWIHGLGEIESDNEGVPLYLVGTIQDVTSRKIAENELMHSKNRYENLVNSLSGIVWEADAETFEFSFVSKQAEVLLGYPIADWLDSPTFWSDHIHPDDKTWAVNYCVAQTKGKLDHEFEYRMIANDGSIVWLLDVVSVVIENDKPKKLHGIKVDITQKKNLDNQLKSTNTRLQLATSAAKIGIWERDIRTNATIWDDTMYEIYNIVDKNGFRFENWFNLVVEEDRTKILELTQAVLASNEVLNVEFRIKRPDESIRIIESKVVSTRDSSGNPVAIIGTNIDVTEQRLAEDSIKHSEERYHSLLLSLEAGIIVHAPDTSIIMNNPKASELLSLRDDQLRGKLAFDPEWNFLNEHGQPLPLEEYPVNRIATSNLPIINQIAGIYRTDKDDVVWVSINGFAMHDSAGEISEIVISFFDITEQKIAAEELRQSEENLHAIIEAITIPTIVTDIETSEVVFANQQTADLFGVPLAEALHQKAREYYSRQEDRDQLVYLLKKQGFVSNFLVEMHRASGEQFWVLVSARTIIFAGRKALVATFYDITKQKNNEVKLQEQAALLDLVPDAIIVRDLEDKIISWSKGAEQMYGYTAAEAIGTFAPALIGTGDVEDFYSARKVLFVEGNWTGEFLQKTKSGKVILVQSRWKLVRNGENVPTSVLVTNTDISEKKSLEKQLFRAQRLESIGTLASGIAHDLNNILTPVVLGMELIKLNLRDESVRKRIETIISTVQRGSGLIGQVLSFARGSHDEREPVNINYIIDEVVKIARETFPREIDVTIDRVTEELMVIGNATQIHQILMNLCINSRDAMIEKGGTLTIKASCITATESHLSSFLDARPGRYVRIVVGDNGIGIPAELQDKIFEPFYTTKEVGKGTGIGLTTVFSIVRNHGGFIELESEENVGTTFTIYLPAVESEAADKIESQQDIQKHSCDEAILIVDDEDLIRNIAEDILQAYGYKVFTAVNGAEAIRTYSKNQDTISAVVTDIMMPVMGGIELMGILRDMNPELPIIAASGVVHGDAAKNLFAAGAKTILLKPFTVDKLLGAIREVLE